MGLRAGCLGVGCWLCLACGEGASRPAPGLGPEGAGGSAGGANGAGSGGALAAAGTAGASDGAESGGTNGQGGSGSPSGLAGGPGLGGTDAEGMCPCDAGSSAEAGAGANAAGASGGADAGGSTCGSLGPDGQQLVTLQPDGIEVFGLPIGSSRVAASGFDPCARVCASIIWDYSNNGLPYVRHCDDFLQYPGFPYVVLLAEQDAPCPGLWEYDGVEPSAASGCIDPGASLVDARVDVEVGGERYVIRANNVP